MKKNFVSNFNQNVFSYQKEIHLQTTNVALQTFFIGRDCKFLRVKVIEISFFALGVRQRKIEQIEGSDNIHEESLQRPMCIRVKIQIRKVCVQVVWLPSKYENVTWANAKDNNIIL